jgi:UDP-N-acetylmuramoyl-L-alanyl-D-glutamate--2,6-diaminopimelate ligase
MNTDLSIILQWLDIDAEHLAINVSGLCQDSRKIKDDNLFVALSGFDNHGIDFAYQAQRGGASAILAESISANRAKPKSRQQPLTIPVIEIENLSEKLGTLAANFYKQPSEKLEIIGITGTNGKTSCAWLMLQAWSKLGINAAYIGTLGYGTIEQMHDLNNTTPSALQLQKLLAGFVEKGITHVSLEISSHGLTLGRVNGLRFKGAAFTNISRDHLDFHETMDNYANAKKKLFCHYPLDFAAININDYYGKKWLPEITSPVISYGINTEEPDIYATNIKLNTNGINFELNWLNNNYAITTSLLGSFNVENILLVTTSLLQQGFKIEEIIKIIPDFTPVPGRMNRVARTDNQPLIIVDYAHTPDALEQVLLALKQHNTRKIWCIFGCGGNRDKGKRPQMGFIAETHADKVIITDDNPRYENNIQITDDILMGMNTQPKVIHARREAIAYAINHAHKNDLILIAGKGHEPYQTINGKRFPFDDRTTAAELLNTSMEEIA